MHTARLQLALLVVFGLFRPNSADAAMQPPQARTGVNAEDSAIPSAQEAQTANAVKTSPPRLAGSTISVQELSIPPSARNAFEKGRRLLVDDHKAEESLAWLHKAVRIAPAYWEAQFLLGVAYMGVRKWNEAEPSLRKAIAINEHLGAAYLALGSCLLEEDEYSEAEQQLLKGLDLDPGTAHGQFDLGRTYYALGRFEEAKLHALRAVDLGPAQADVHFLLGNILLHLGENQEALAEFRECSRLSLAAPLATLAQEQANRVQTKETSSR